MHGVHGKDMRGGGLANKQRGGVAGMTRAERLRKQLQLRREIRHGPQPTHVPKRVRSGLIPFVQRVHRREG